MLRFKLLRNVAMFYYGELQGISAGTIVEPFDESEIQDCLQAVKEGMMQEIPSDDTAYDEQCFSDGYGAV